MASNDRQVQRRMRERGAGITRDLKNTSFNFTFGGSKETASRSASKTPQLAARRSSIRKTPSTTRKQSNRRISSVKKNVQGQESDVNRSQSDSGKAIAEDEQRSVHYTTESRGATAEAHTETPSVRIVARKRKRSSHVTIPDEANQTDELEQEDEHVKAFGRRSWGEQIPIETRRSLPMQLQTITDEEDELGTPAASHTPEPSRRISLGDSINRRLGERVYPKEDDASSTRTPAALQTPAAASRGRHPALVATPGTAVSGLDDDSGTPGETHSAFIKRMYKPRRPLASVGEQGRKNPSRPSDTETGRKAPVAVMHRSQNAAGKQTADKALDYEEDQFEMAMDGDDFEASALSEAQTPRLLMTHNDPTVHNSLIGIPEGSSLFMTPNLMARDRSPDELSPERGRKRRRTVSLGDREEESSSEPSRQASSAIGATTAQDEAPVNTSHKTKKTVASSKTKKSKRSIPANTTGTSQDDLQADRTATRNTTIYPITVYRLSRPDPHDGEDGAQSDDELTHTQTQGPSTRGLPAVNPVDVLAQICSELIEHMAATAHRLPTSHLHMKSRRTTIGGKETVIQNRPPQAEIKRKRGVLRHFQQTLSDALFEITIALDAGNVLSSRLRGLNREKIELREELLSVRKQREEVALKIDRARREHIEWKDAVNAKDELSADLWDIELAVAKGREACKARKERGDELGGKNIGLSMAVDIAKERIVGYGASGIGVSERLQSFNTVLTRAANALEGRKT